MKLDVFNHVFPETFIETLEGTMPRRAVARWRSIETLWNMDARMRMLDEFGDYQQIVSMSQPPIDVLGGPDRTPALARIANDGMAAICRAHPDRFPGFLLSLPMNNPDEAVKEVDRAVTELGACAAQIHSNVPGPGARTTPPSSPSSSGWNASASRSSCTRRGRCRMPITGRRTNRSTRSSGGWAGPTRPRRRWRASSSRACSTSSRISRSWRITGAPTSPTPRAGCRTGRGGRRNRTRPITARSRTI